MTGAVFCHVSMDDLAKLIREARQLAIIAAPGIDEAIASAIILATQAIGPDNVRVILDVAEENCRAGYGNVDGYSTLIDKGIRIRRCQGLRIGFVLADTNGFVFSLPPQMVEAPAKLKGCPNAIRATPEQIMALEAATRPPSREPSNPSPTDSTRPTPPSGPSQPPSPSGSPMAFSGGVTEIGETDVTKVEIKQIEANIRSNPVQDFDLSRVVNVFTAHVQFVELGVEGANLEAHTVKLPAELLTVVRDKATRDRLTAAFKMVSEGSKISGDNIRKAANEIRKRYIRTMSIYGGVILKTKRTQLEAEVDSLGTQLENHKSAVRGKFLKEAEKSKKELVQAFWRAVRASPPDDLLAQIANEKPTMDEAKAYLAAKLDQVFPDVEKLCEGMKVAFVTKDVTWETLNSPNFIDWLAKQFPANRELKKPFEEFRAARQRLDVASKMPRVAGR